VYAKARLGGFAGGLVECLGGEPIAGVPTEADSSCLRVDVGPSKLVRFDGDEEGFGGALVSVREGFRPLASIRVGVADAVAKTPSIQRGWHSGALLHAVPAVFDVGHRTPRLYRALSLGLMILFLVGAMAAHWQQLSTAERVIFSGLFLLALYMGWRALSARGLLGRRSEQWRLPYMEHIGITLIAL
jgi:hypothetical protein